MTSIQDHTTRQLMLEGAFNVRELGGLVIHAGQRTRTGQFLRADSLHALSPASQSRLLEYGLKTVIDLRTSKEIMQEPNPFAKHEGVRYINISLFETIMQNQNANTMSSLESIYIAALDHCQPAMVEVLETLATSQSVTLFHCTAGKDRTGIISALLLANAGVPHEVITQDYTLTEELAKPMLERLLNEAIKTGVDKDSYSKLLTARAATMQATLWYLEARFGSVEGYLSDGLGLEQHTIDALRFKMLELES
jgi:protein-tyrosine phosphatase